MGFNDAEARLEQLLNRHACAQQAPGAHGFAGLCQVNGSNNRIVIHVHCARHDDATPPFDEMPRILLRPKL